MAKNLRTNQADPKIMVFIKKMCICAQFGDNGPKLEKHVEEVNQETRAYTPAWQNSQMDYGTGLQAGCVPRSRIACV